MYSRLLFKLDSMGRRQGQAWSAGLRVHSLRSHSGKSFRFVLLPVSWMRAQGTTLDKTKNHHESESRGIEESSCLIQRWTASAGDLATAATSRIAVKSGCSVFVIAWFSLLQRMRKKGDHRPRNSAQYERVVELLIMHKANWTQRQISLLPSVSRPRSIIKQLRKSRFSKLFDDRPWSWNRW